jgi:hypothetical protein
MNASSSRFGLAFKNRLRAVPSDASHGTSMPWLLLSQYSRVASLNGVCRPFGSRLSREEIVFLLVFVWLVVVFFTGSGISF